MATATMINTKADEAVAAIESGDLATALTKLLAVKALLSVKFDQQDGAGTQLLYDRAAIDDLIKQVRKQQHAGAGLQHQKIKYVLPTD